MILMLSIQRWGPSKRKGANVPPVLISNYQLFFNELGGFKS